VRADRKDAGFLDAVASNRSALLASESRLSLIAAGLFGAMELASDLPRAPSEMLRKALFLGALRALTLREETRRELREHESLEGYDPNGRSYR
jgi:hypothetical protein